MTSPERLVALVEYALKGGLAPVLARVAELEHRLETLEATAPVPGPPGPVGPAGLAGKDGAPGLVYAGVYVDGQTYALGEVVTHGGSAWHCQAETTAKPGEAAADWQLMVKRGKDGRDLRAERN